MITNALKDTVIDISSGQQSIDRLLENGDAQDDDIEIVQKSIVLNLKCPISLTVIKTPTKGAHCKHPAVSTEKKSDTKKKPSERVN